MDELTVDGYQFLTKEDAALARTEEQKIELIDKKINYSNPDEMLLVYHNAIEQRAFFTPIGIHFLYELRSKILKAGINEDTVKAIPMPTVFAKGLKDKEIIPKKKPVSQNNKNRKLNVISLILNGALIVLIIIMFSVLLNAKNPNILNYKDNLENKYASWQEELKQKEADLREKEKELNSQF